MICFYNKNETDFTHNGLGVLDNYIINPVIMEELNGIFSLEFDYPLTAPHADGLLQERLVKCPVPEMPPQLFRISEREAAFERGGGTFRVVAYHVFFDLAQNFIEDTFIVNRNGQETVRQMLSASQFPHSFTGFSDIAIINSARLVRRNIVEAFLNDDLGNSFLSRWGGEILRDNFDVHMRRVRGSDNGVSIRDKKNLTGYRSNVDFGTIVTRIMPQGFDGLFLPEKYIDSPLIGNYLTPRIRVIKYEQVKAAVGIYAQDDDALPLPQALELLRKLAREEFSVHNIDKPNATYYVEFVPLEKTEEYKNFAVLEKIAMGDVVTVIHEEDGLDISARMVSYKYNPFTESYIAITLGNFAPKFTDISKAIQRIDADVSQANDNANFALQSANGKNTNFYGSEEPSEPRINDLWFKENGEKIEMWIYEERDGETQWFPLSTDLTQEQIRLELEAAKALVAEASQKAGEAMEAGQAAQTAAEKAETDAANAVTEANKAFDAADLALAKIGSPFMVRPWFQGTITPQGDNVDSTSNLRSGFIAVKSGDNYIAQFPDGVDALTANYHFYNMPSYTDFVPAARQWWVWHVTGQYTNSTIINYLNTLAIETMAITDNINLNTYTGQGDMLLIHRLPLGGRPVPKVIQWFGRKDTSDNAIFIFSNNAWHLIGMVTEGGADKIHEWVLTESQRNGITSENIHICFFAIKQGSWAGVYNNSTTPHTLNPQSAGEKLLQHISSVTSDNAVTAPANITAMRVRIATAVAPDVFTGNVYQDTERRDRTEANTVYSAILQQSELINLRVVKGEIINQINISPESILIAGNRIHITGQTTINNGVITTAMIADAAITNAKIANLDAGKINTGTLAAARIAAGSITSDKLTISNGFITNAMIADATIQNAKIATLDAAKITTGTLTAARIGAGTITADKLATNAIQVGLGGWNQSIRINPTNINWFDGNDLQGMLTADGLAFYQTASRFIGRFAGSHDVVDNNIKGVSMHLNGQGDYLSWGARAGTSGTYTSFLILDPYGKLSGGTAGLHLGTHLRTKGYNFYTSGNRIAKMTDLTLTTGGVTIGTFPAWGGDNGRARIAFGTDHLYLVSNNVFSTVTVLTTRISELITRVNQLITRLNNGWVVAATGSTSSYANTGLSTMGTSLTT
jgi:phage minor structural protein